VTHYNGNAVKMSVEKKFSCPVCGTKLPFSYALRIADGKRHVCERCHTHLVPKTDNVIYIRVAIIAVTFILALVYGKVVFDYYGFERSILASFIHFAVLIVFYLGLTYFAIVRVVRMKKLEF